METKAPKKYFASGRNDIAIDHSMMYASIYKSIYKTIYKSIPKLFWNIYFPF